MAQDKKSKAYMAGIFCTALGVAGGILIANMIERNLLGNAESTGL
tara:strand:+ start:187 stop:321 length:135 start_codon:yes stop_codon:yes gene_type:complete